MKKAQRDRQSRDGRKFRARGVKGGKLRAGGFLHHDQMGGDDDFIMDDPGDPNFIPEEEMQAPPRVSLGHAKMSKMVTAKCLARRKLTRLRQKRGKGNRAFMEHSPAYASGQPPLDPDQSLANMGKMLCFLLFADKLGQIYNESECSFFD